jgi:hypothetical protein
MPEGVLSEDYLNAREEYLGWRLDSLRWRCNLDRSRNYDLKVLAQSRKIRGIKS